MGQRIDLITWKRREHYQLFRRFRQPFFSVCVDVDATALWQCSKLEGGPPFFLTSLFLMLRAANATEAFRLRVRKRGVWLHDRLAVGPTLLRPDHTFAFTRIESSTNLKQFIAAGTKAMAHSKARRALDANPGDDDIVFHSSLPWLRFTSFTNAIGGPDSIPRIVFGRCGKAGRRFVMPVAVEVHHAVVDGLDVARFMERFQHALSGFRPGGPP
jgi:chloramphenicol O-acetyltransferase type A